ncbi:EpsD family peptidyl-prolyl cis-trans isomerase [Thiohalocapsa marina]|nr:EpsD family peptidyl-prolyl cis-trans isomerase [Thiohalocapsa marina]
MGAANRQPWATSALCAMVALMALGCDIGPMRSTGGSGQTAVIVDDREISVHQVDRALQTQQVQGRKTEPSDVIRRLVDRQLAVNEALKVKLDRDPRVMLQLEEIRLDVLANAYASKVAADIPNPTPDEIRAFYERHPELFAQRKFFALSELYISVESPGIEEVRTRLFEGQGPVEVAAWLDQQGLAYHQDTVVRTSEQIPLEALPGIHKAKVGDRVIFESPRTLYVYTILMSVDSPYNLERAESLIIDYLNKQKVKKEMAWRMQSLRQAASIQYLQEPGTQTPAPTDQQ